MPLFLFPGVVSFTVFSSIFFTPSLVGEGNWLI